MSHPCAGLIFDESFHYIDHLAPFCALMDWPLLVCEESVAAQCEQYYPMTEVILTDFSSLPPCIVSCNPLPLLKSTLGPWQGRFIWLPHGQSDKGWKTKYFEALGEEDLVLVYGERMRGVLRAKNVGIPQISVGNFRWQFYQDHRAFYDTFVEKRFGPEPFILYAPTWDDFEQKSSLWDAFDVLVDATQRPLLIKLHPNLQKVSPAKIEWIQGKGGRSKHVSFVDDFPPIYPLLNKASVYIGDRSSIGYDYLRFRRPMYFLTKQRIDPALDPSGFIMQCGEQVLYDEIPGLFARTPQSFDTRSLASLAFDEISVDAVRVAINQWVAH